MPELPEVQTVVNDLQGVIRGQVIKKVIINSPRQVTPSAEEFARLLKGKTILGVTRRAKVLVFHLSSKLVMIGHMKMTGQFVYRTKAGRLKGGGHPFGIKGLGLPNRYTQVQFEFASGDTLYFNDTRKFGYLKLMANSEWQELSAREWGIDPFNRGFTAAQLLGWAKRRSLITIKQLIMDQSLLAGVGNIYADESLFASRINPRRLAGTITAAEAHQLVIVTKGILKRAVAARGTTMNDYLDGRGQPGTFRKFLKVYGRGKLTCVRCGRPLAHTVIGGRGTVYCAHCQK